MSRGNSPSSKEWDITIYKGYEDFPVNLTGRGPEDPSSSRMESLIDTSITLLRGTAKSSDIPLDTLSLPVESPVKISQSPGDHTAILPLDTLNLPAQSPVKVSQSSEDPYDISSYPEPSPMSSPERASG